MKNFSLVVFCLAFAGCAAGNGGYVVGNPLVPAEQAEQKMDASCGCEEKNKPCDCESGCGCSHPAPKAKTKSNKTKK